MNRKVKCWVAALASIGCVTAAALLGGSSGAVADATSSGGGTGSCVSLPSSVAATHDGGHLYHFSPPTGGGTLTYPVPPSGFSPVNASDADLALYGFPPRPSDPAALATWTQVMSTYKTMAPPDLCWNSAPPPPASVTAPSNATSGNWSGHVDEPASGNSFIGVSAQFYQPQRLTETCTNTHESTWVGLGGYTHRSDNSVGLLQDGTAYGPTGSPYAWFEWWGEDPNGNPNGVSEQSFSTPVSPGDLMWFETLYDPSTGETDFYVLNETTGQAEAATKDNSQTGYDGRTSDWIVERPSYTVGGQQNYYWLQNFDKVDWSDGEYTLQNNATLKIAQANITRNVTMMNGTDELATATTLQGTGDYFESNFHHCS